MVSGLALGVDAAAHHGALETAGPAVAVLAGGADVPYPAVHRRLHAAVAARGCVVSELPPGFGAMRWCFVARNRIIAGLAEVTVVVEATVRSGSLTTADFAANAGRQVAAVPGPVTSRLAEGTNGLIAAGAALVRDARDVLELLLGPGAVPDSVADLGRPGRRPPAPVTALEAPLRALLDAVEQGRGSLEALAHDAGAAPADPARPHRARAPRPDPARLRRTLRPPAVNAAAPVGVASSCRYRPGVAVEPETDPVTGELYIDRVPFAPAREDPLLERAVPVTRDVRRYRPDSARRDLTAGLTVAALAVPSAMAYAELAGVNAVHGLYTILLPCLAYTLLGSKPAVGGRTRRVAVGDGCRGDPAARRAQQPTGRRAGRHDRAAVRRPVSGRLGAAGRLVRRLPQPARAGRLHPRGCDRGHGVPARQAARPGHQRP